MTKKTYALYLAKPDIVEFQDVLSQSAQARIGTRLTHVAAKPDFGEGAQLYIFDSPEDAPRWLKELRTSFNISANVETSSACGVLVFRVSGRVFAVSFAHGWMYLNEDNLEGDFGLRAAINALDDNKLKRLERANLGDAMRGVSQSPFQRDLRSFGVDDALDLVRKVSGKARDENTADAITGARSFKVTGEYDLSSLPIIAEEALRCYGSTAYRRNSFQILDVVTPVTDRRLTTVLDHLAAESIRTDQAEFELGLPTQYDEDNVAFRFSGPRVRGRYPDLLLRNYQDALGDRLNDLTAETLREHRIVASYDDPNMPDQNWTIRKSLIGSLAHEDGRYATNEGEWYRVDEQFREAIERQFRALVTSWDTAPVPLAKVYDAGGNNCKYQSEATYNAQRASALGYTLLDTESVNVPGVQRSGFEPCDMLDIEGKRLIHVKKSSRRSSVLSHFFKQGSNSAQNFKRYPAAWSQLIDLTRRISGDERAEQLETSINDTQRKWTVEFWIADTPRVDGAFNIPFFSKISLRDETNSLLAMEYEVVLRFIPLEAINL